MADFTESNLCRPSAPSEYLLKKPKAKRKKLKVDVNKLKHNKRHSASLGPQIGFRTSNLANTQQRIATNNKNNNNTSRRGVETNNEDSACHDLHSGVSLPGNSEETASKETHILSSQGESADHKNMNPKSNHLSAHTEFINYQMRCSGQETEINIQDTHPINVSDIQEQFTKMDLKQCEKDLTLLKINARNLAVSKTYEETLGDYFMSGKAEVNHISSVRISVTDSVVNKVHYPRQNETLIDTSISTQGNVSETSKNETLLPVCERNKMITFILNKRKKINHLFRYVWELKWRGNSKKEDKQLLVEEDVMGEEDDPVQGGVQVHHNKTRPLSECTTIQVNVAAAAKKRRRPRKKNVFRAGCRLRHSLGRGCHYIGHGLVNMTSTFPEASFMGPVTPTRGYECEFISSDYVTTDYTVSPVTV
ncbi:uncharacterized protein LOC121868066 [Homarus americanus]|uniref:Uncharacterized protein n=1 Tax=Homarus americanus TaxID=6706 RepID=A0A8J5K581_HOMAM|nr:uncharacterized protein LOC121868066 [Homarus americanus]KAG7167684.1 hypothetical protein Hamer_G020566 [Homarus americanus]